MLDGIESSRAILEAIWPTFPLQPVVFWAAVCFVLLRVAYWIVARVRGHFWRRDMKDRIVTFLSSWDELLDAYNKRNSQRVGELMSKLMILYVPIGPYVRRQAHITYYGTPERPIVNPNYDLIGNFLAGNSEFDFETSWRMGRQALLGCLGALGFKPD